MPGAGRQSARRAAAGLQQPLQVLITDEGLNGLHVHVINESATAAHGATDAFRRLPRWRIRHRARHANAHACLARDAQARGGGTASITFSISPTPTASARPRMTWSWPACTTRRTATRCSARRRIAGPPRRSIAHARVECRGGTGGWRVVADRQHAAFARWVHIEDHALRPEQDWFHLGPGESAPYPPDE